MRFVFVVCFVAACSAPDHPSPSEPVSSKDPAPLTRPPPPPPPAPNLCASGKPVASWTECDGFAASDGTKTLCFATAEEGCQCKCGVRECAILESFPPQLACPQ